MYILFKKNICITDQHSEVHLMFTTVLELTQTQNYNLLE